MIITTVDHPFYVKNQDFIAAAELQVGYETVNSNGDVLVVEDIQVKGVEGSETVYNFQVEDFHTYYVSELGVLVHNASSDYSRSNRMGRQKGKSPRDQQKQQRQVRDIKKELRKLGVPEDQMKDYMHDILHDRGYDYQEALQAAKDFFGK